MDSVAFLHSLPPSTIRLGLDRVAQALADLGHPELKYKTVHVAGTNGKGSTCAFISRALHAHGHRVGLYTSPHLQSFNERIQIDGRPISDELLARRLDEVLQRYSRSGERPFPLTHFELGTLAALHHFAEERVDIAVLETGLGGRLDATNCCRPEVTAITPISFDHMEFLGKTLAAIAGEKAGILKSGTPAIFSRQPDEALAALQSAAKAVGVAPLVEGRDFELDAAMSYRGRRWTLSNVQLSLRGSHQRQNAGVALAVLEALADRVPVSKESALEGLRTANWPGRLEELGRYPTVVLDGAHNPAGAEALPTALETLYAGRRIHAVFSVLADKDWEQIASRVFPRCASLQLCPVQSPRALQPKDYAEKAATLCPEVHLYRDVKGALEGARRMAAKEDVVLCTGSLMLVGAVYDLVVG
jgi:dihydrofolate synthase/folylpolyglutamate synthase